MLKVLIVDDEKIIRDGMVSGVDWEGLGFQVVGQAEDGEIAVEKVRELRPDLVITDIKMPFIDGLQLVEILKKRYSDVITVIISGHDEFEYARRALKLGAYDYLLKPLDLDYLSRMLVEISIYIRDQRKIRDDSIEYRLSRIFRKIWSQSDVSDKDAAFLEKTWSSRLQNLVFYAAVLSVDPAFYRQQNSSAADTQLLDYFIRSNIGDARLTAEKKIQYLDEGRYGIILAGSDFEGLKEGAGLFFSGLAQSFQTDLGLSVFISISEMHKSLSGLQTAVAEAESACRFRYIAGNKRLLYYGSIKEKDNPEYSHYDISEVVAAVKIGDKGMLEEELKKILKAAVSRREHAKEFISFICAGLMNAAAEILKEYSIDIGQVFEDPVHEFMKLSSLSTLKSAIEGLNEILCKIIDQLDALRKTGLFSRIEEAKKYINDNYKKKQLSLQMVSDEVHMNLSYLSEIFKKYTGKSYIEYLTEYRIEKASDFLLNTDFRSYEIADMVGYENPTYFSTVFKKITGVSPLDFRRNSARIQNGWEDD